MQEKCEGHAKKEGGKPARRPLLLPSHQLIMLNYAEKMQLACDAIIFSPISCTVFLLFS